MHFLIINACSFKSTVAKISVFVLTLFLLTACTEEPQKQQVTVTFNSQAGSAVPDATIDTGKAVAEPTAPTRTGFVFGGWFTDEATTPANVYDFDDPVNANLTLYAKWTAITLTVMFDSQGGSAVEDVPVEYGQPVAEPTPPTKASSIFKGWFKEQAMTTAYDFDDPVNANLTLYAKWVDAVTVAFDSQGGSAVADVIVEKGQPVAEPTPPTKANSIFKGWFKEQAMTTAYVFSTPVIINLTVYAKWVDASTVMFDSQGGSAVADVLVENGQPVAEPTPPTKTSSIFKGWFTDQNTTPANAYDFDDPVNANLTLYAKWANALTVMFDSQGGSAVADVIVEEGQPVAEPTPPTKASSIFKGWFTDQNTTPANAYDFDDPVNANLTLYAKWVPAFFTVALKSDATTELATQQVPNNDNPVYEKQPFVVSGKYISGYFTDVNKTMAFDFDSVLTTDITLYVNAKDRVKPANRAALMTEVNSAITANTPSPDLNYINTEDITNMDSVFREKRTFNGDVSLWDVSKVTSMKHMFSNARAFNADISQWNVGSVTNMERMFFGALAFNQNISQWDVSNVTNMQRMFSAAITFNQNISGWDVSSVTNMISMFDFASAFNQDLEAWKEHFNLVDGKFTGSKSDMFTNSKVNPPPTWF